MKRFVVIITSLLIIFIFIALNYLLWDRESLLNLRESNQASIDALGRINMTLNEDKSRLEKQIEELRSQMEARDEEAENLEAEIQAFQKGLNEKSQFISILKSQVNTVPLQNETIEWIYAVADKNYPAAYMKSESDCSFWDETWSLKTFSDYFKENLTIIEPVFQGDEQPQPVIEVTASETPDLEMQVLVRVNVELAEGANEEYLKHGMNVLSFLYTYSERVDQWVIMSVSSMETESEETGSDREKPDEGISPDEEQ